MPLFDIYSINPTRDDKIGMLLLSIQLIVRYNGIHVVM